MTDLGSFDYVLAMDRSNLTAVQRMADGRTAPVIAMFLSFANAAGTVDTVEVPDPYYDGRFDAVYELVSKGSEALLTHIRKKHNL